MINILWMKQTSQISKISWQHAACMKVWNIKFKTYLHNSYSQSRCKCYSKIMEMKNKICKNFLCLKEHFWCFRKCINLNEIYIFSFINCKKTKNYPIFCISILSLLCICRLTTQNVDKLSLHTHINNIIRLLLLIYIYKNMLCSAGASISQSSEGGRVGYLYTTHNKEKLTSRNL